jgi:hypothetical protein
MYIGHAGFKNVPSSLSWGNTYETSIMEPGAEFINGTFEISGQHQGSNALGELVLGTGSPAETAAKDQYSEIMKEIKGEPCLIHHVLKRKMS